MKLNVYGKKLEVIRLNKKWIVLILGSEGKKRLAENIIIPSTVKDDELIGYLSDIPRMGKP